MLIKTDMESDDDGDEGAHLYDKADQQESTSQSVSVRQCHWVMIWLDLILSKQADHSCCHKLAYMFPEFKLYFALNTNPCWH